MAIDKTLEGKVAVITGGARGIGKGVAKALIERGAKVVIGNRSVDQGEATVKEFNDAAGYKVASFIRTDVKDYKDNIALFQFAEKEFGGVDIAFLNAGIMGKGVDTPFTLPDDEIDTRIMSVNGSGTMKGTKIALLHMAKQKKKGVIVHCSSILGMHQIYCTAAYVAAKHALTGWTRSFGLLPQICDVRVNAVCPGFLDLSEVPVYDTDSMDGPIIDLFTHVPKTKLQTVIDAVLLLIEDEQRNAQTLLALPGNEILVEEPPTPIEAPLLGSAVTPEFEEQFRKYERDTVKYQRKVLAETIREYEEKYSN
ncbi:hypothetical protein INT45_003827 [Circinella minor]|uniref:Uncharacterized protein n=1 Tax=Circinella minor TaxID=1195481 RepID=A0A8H7SFB0_9FUNG|nr:hypothetical protein INT45_003827 [Circinella minor]